jgi:phage terminase large subunit-like protein
VSHVVIAIDPAITAGGDETGIVATARAGERAFVLEDASGSYTPEAWAQRTVEVAKRWKARYPRARVEIYAETNRGGQMVGATLRAAGMGSIVGVRFVEDHAYKGKATRAEPVAALYEQRRVVHTVQSRKLEDQLCQWSPGGSQAAADRHQSRSPDRMDALVHGVHRLGFHLRVVAFTPTPDGGERRAFS